MIRPVDVALRYEGVREVGGPNRGPEIDRWLRMVGKDPARGAWAWCAAFVCGCTYDAYQENFNAAGNVGPFDPKLLPIPMTAGVHMLWGQTPIERRTIPKAGAVFIIDKGVSPKTGQRIGHTGFVVAVDGSRIHTIEGNTDGGGSRDGDGVYKRIRWISDIKGFLDVSARAKVALSA